MHFQETLKEPLLREISITFSSQEIEDKLDNYLKQLGQKVKIPGFRPGKTPPLSALRARYEESSYPEVLQDLLKEVCEKVIQDNNLNPALPPRYVEKHPFKKGEDYTGKIVIELLPQVPDIAIKDLVLTRFSVPCTQEFIEKSIANICIEHGEKTAASQGEVAKVGHFAKVHVCIHHEGTLLEEFDQTTEIKDTFFLEKHIVGMKKGETKRVKLPLPYNENLYEFEGKLCEFDLQLEEIYNNKPAELTQDFLISLGFEDKKKLEESIRSLWTQGQEKGRFRIMRFDLFEHLDKECAFDVPKGLVKEELKQMIETKLHEQSKKLSEDEISQWIKEHESVAQRRVRIGLFFARVIGENNLEVSAKEINDAIRAGAASMNVSSLDLRKFYEQNHEKLGALRNSLLENKVVHFLISQATVEEKSISSEEFNEELSKREQALAQKTGEKHD